MGEEHPSDWNPPEAHPSSQLAAAPLARIVGQSPAIRLAKAELSTHAPLGTSVLIVGETGTGKGLAADVLHALSRRPGECVHVNCATIVPELAESRLFGHERGAFTSAHKQHVGAIERAHEGTLFLDELTELTTQVQAKLLTVLDNGRYERLGGTSVRESRFRLVAATSADIERALATGRLRTDLYHRIRTAFIRLPPLAVRGYDVVLIARELAGRVAADVGRASFRLTQEAEAQLLGRAWDGNVRQLRNVLTTALIRAEDGLIDDKVMGMAIDTEALSPSDRSRWLPTLDEALEAAKREAIARALAAAEGNKAEAAELLGISTSTLYRYRRELGME